MTYITPTFLAYIGNDKAELYSIYKWPSGRISCNCPHFTHRLEGTDQHCKHITRYLSLGVKS
jgi:hypothetical protein